MALFSRSAKACVKLGLAVPFLWAIFRHPQHCDMGYILPCIIQLCPRTKVLDAAVSLWERLGKRVQQSQARPNDSANKCEHLRASISYPHSWHKSHSTDDAEAHSAQGPSLGL
eukprot:scaffold435_cov285-Pinguiococcus_pyrenoidosus.AAC.2